MLARQARCPAATARGGSAGVLLFMTRLKNIPSRTAVQSASISE